MRNLDDNKLGVLDEILNLIESVSEGFPSFFWYQIKAYEMYFNLIYTSRYQILIIKTISSLIYKFIHSSSSSPLKKRNFKISHLILGLLQQTWYQIKELKKFFNLIYTFIYVLLTVKGVVGWCYGAG